MFQSDEAIDPMSLARAVEDRGFDSLWFPDHTHVPVDRRTPWPGGGPLPREYYRLYDPIVALAMAAAVTSRIRLATGVLLVAQRDPIVTAKELATLDRLSNGRLTVGIGTGWSHEEMHNHGTTPQDRFAIADERLAAMKAIWTEDAASFHGRHVDFDPIHSWPKPVQQPHPPIAIGGNSEGALRRVVALGDEWVPASGLGIAELAAQVIRLDQLLAEAGRDRLPISLYGAPQEPAAIESLAAIGVSRCIFAVPPATADLVLPALDRLQQLVARVEATTHR